MLYFAPIALMRIWTCFGNCIWYTDCKLQVNVLLCCIAVGFIVSLVFAQGISIAMIVVGKILLLLLVCSTKDYLNFNYSLLCDQ